jgi:hypothetical protein
MAVSQNPHVKLNTQAQSDAPVALRFNYGFGNEEEEEEENEDPDYTQMVVNFRNNLTQLRLDQQSRIEQRSPQLAVPRHIDYVKINFQSQFVVTTFFPQWYDEFGLMAIHFSKFNTEGLFAVVDNDKFQLFLQEIEHFIANVTGAAESAFSRKVVFMDTFKLLTSNDMRQFEEPGTLMNVRLMDEFPLDEGTFTDILISLQRYLGQNNITYTYDAESKNLEIIGANQQQIEEVIRNFDIVWHVTSALATVVSPSELNLPNRSYGFTIGNAGDNLPIIGILDTGISNLTPLAGLLINDISLNITGSSPLIDNCDHGTAVAALAALGKKPYRQGYRGEIQADARLLSIKILDANSGFLSQKSVINLLEKAKHDYPEIKLFVLTIGYEHHKSHNEDYSAYAYVLDKFAHENDCLVYICTSNNGRAAGRSSYDWKYFREELTNLCVPAESMNNLTVGAAADYLRPGAFAGCATAKEFPSIYTRKGHIDLSLLFSRQKLNKRYFKPDVIESGGDYEMVGGMAMQGPNASMEVLSSDPQISFYPNVGTSFSTPLVANIGAQLQKQYPSIRAQSIKALIINAASLNFIRFEPLDELLRNRVSGHGLTDEVRAVFSNDNAITFLIEDEISPEQVKIFPIHFPSYLTQSDLGKKRGILQVTATLCFSFLPVASNQLAYCPIHMGYSIFRNHTGDEILAPEKIRSSLLKGNLRWSQSARYKAKPIPCTNTQKITFPVNVQDLQDESSTFKVAVNCRIHPQLFDHVRDCYNHAHKFSMAITLEETLPNTRKTGRLYNEAIAVNEIENIAAISLEAEGTLDAEV